MADEREGDNAAAGAFLAGRVQQLEADLETARQQADAAAQTEIALRRQLAAATAGRDGDEAEGRQLKDELAAVKTALARQEERDREAASARTILERDRESQRAAAVAEARSRGEARLVEVLAEAAKTESEKAEYARQKQELEQALAAVSIVALHSWHVRVCFWWCFRRVCVCTRRLSGVDDTLTEDTCAAR